MSTMLDELTAEDFFAAVAMHALMTTYLGCHDWSKQEMAEEAYRMAQEMMDARDE